MIPRRIRLLLAMLTVLAMGGWTYVIMLLESAQAWGEDPTDRVRYTLSLLPYVWLVFNLATCWRPSRALCAVGLLVNLPALMLAVAWFSQAGGMLPGYALLIYVMAWYAYAAKILQKPRQQLTMAPFSR